MGAATQWGMDGGHVVSVNVGMPRLVPWRGRLVSTAIWKEPVTGRVRIAAAGLEGDRQADSAVHGGIDKAVYAYAEEDFSWWLAALGRPLAPGTFGENLTVAGVDVTGALVGERWRVGGAQLVVTSPRIPCFKLGIRMGDQGFPRRFAAAGRPGAYLRVVQPGEVAAGDPVAVLDRPMHGVTVGTVERAYHGDRSDIAQLLDVPGLPDGWREWARSVLDRRG
jgi:MOSC domain-containing protein YiiM